MKNSIFTSFVELTSRPFSSSLLKRFATSTISRPMIKPFASFYQIKLEEADLPISEYRSLNDFFTRSLKEGKRPVDTDPLTLVSPVDGVLSSSGTVDGQQRFKVKDRYYSLEKLFGDARHAAPYKEGYFFLFYLSPQHYHHFHYPVDGQLISRYALGTTSYPVNDFGLGLKPDVFTSNYRIISEIESSFGRIAVVKVGALNVNSIHIANSDKVCRKGDNFGHFSFGSTVIVFVENKEALQPAKCSCSEVKVGDKIGVWQY